MRLYPAIDILEGSAVRLVKGDFGAITVYDEDPRQELVGPTTIHRDEIGLGARR